MYQESMSAFKNLVYGFGGALKLSFLTLFARKPFPLSRTLDSQRGVLIPEKELHPCIWNNIFSLFSFYSQSRKNFESAPDTGFLSKSMARPFNVLKNLLLLISGLGVNCTILPVVSALGIATGLGGLLSSPILAAAYGAFSYLFDIFILDRYSYYGLIRSVFPLLNVTALRISGGAVLAAVNLAGTILLPTSGLVGIGVSSLSWLTRRIYDRIIYTLIIKPFARMPYGNGFLIRRIAGPGVAQTFHFEIDKNLALVALLSYLDGLIIQAYQVQTEEQIKAPAKNIQHGLNGIFQELGMTVRESSLLMTHLKKQAASLRTELLKKVKQFNENLSTRGKIPAHCRQDAGTLNETLHEAALLLEQIVPTHLFPKLSQDDQVSFWENRQLLENDWVGLAKNCLVGIFGSNFLTPIEEEDSFTLKVQHIAAKEYVNMLSGHLPHREDLDLAHPIYANRSKKHFFGPFSGIQSWDSVTRSMVQPPPLSALKYNFHSK